MALQDIKDAIGVFLTSPDPSVIAISGAWGTGKTYIWKDKIKECPVWGPKSLALGTKAYSKYSYVSASNCTSMAELKAEILAFSVPYQKAGNAPSVCRSFLRNNTAIPIFGTIIGSLLTLFFQNDSSGGKWLTCAFICSLFSAIFQLLFNLWQQRSLDLALKNSIICIDDVERAEKINPYDILHFAAWLREERNCKVALLLNADRIKKSEETKEKDRTFEEAIEKGTNQFLKLNLTSQEAGTIWQKIIIEKKASFPQKWIKPFLDITTELGICNIRVLEHLATALNRWHKYLEPHENSNGYEDLQNYIFSGTIITGWGHFEPDLCLSWKNFKSIVEKEAKEKLDKKLEISSEQENSEIEPCSFMKIKKIFRKKFNYTFSILKTLNFQVPFFPECLKNVQNGYLSNTEELEELKEKIQKFINNTEARYEKEAFSKILNHPTLLIWGEDALGDTTKEFEDALKTIESIPLDKISQINFIDASNLLHSAEGMAQKKWSDDFLKKYIERMHLMAENIFPEPFNQDKTIIEHLISNVYLPLKEAYWKERDRRLNINSSTAEDTKAYIEKLIEGGYRQNPPIILTETWRNLVKNEYNFSDILSFSQTLSEVRNTTPTAPIEAENFKNLISALKQLMEEKLIWKVRFEHFFKRGSRHYIYPPEGDDNS